MKIKLKKIPIYFLTTGNNDKRKKHILNIFKDYNITEVNPVMGISRHKSGCTGMGRIVDLGMRNQDRKQPFQPFMLIEDDISFYQEVPDEIEIPDDSDLFFVGISICGAMQNKDSRDIYAKDYNNDIVRIYNMLSGHGIIIASGLGAVMHQRCMTEAYFKNKHWDIPVAHSQQFYNCYSLKKPLLYQDKAYGGQEKATKFILQKYISDKKYPIFGNFTETIHFIQKKK